MPCSPPYVNNRCRNRGEDHDEQEITEYMNDLEKQSKTLIQDAVKAGKPELAAIHTTNLVLGIIVGQSRRTENLLREIRDCLLEEE